MDVGKRYFEWISVQEGYPEDGERVLVTRKNIPNRPELCVWNGYYEVWDDSEGDDVAYDKEDIECWMRIRTTMFD